jgi:SAM-dependent methyltransferase
VNRDYESIFAQRGSRYDAAMRRYPQARAEEFRMVTAPLEAGPGDRVADIPSGGGYLAAYLPADVKLLAIEPVAEFTTQADTGPGPGNLRCPIDQVPLPDASLQAIISLAGLHHQADRPAFYREAWRLLKPGGQLIIADGQRASPVAEFLNGFVDRHNPAGHQGWFLGPEDLDAIAACGFSIDSQEPVRYHWRFPDRDAAVDFCRDLFGLECSHERLLKALREELELAEDESGWRLSWALLRINARRPTCPD